MGSISEEVRLQMLTFGSRVRPPALQRVYSHTLTLIGFLY